MTWRLLRLADHAVWREALELLPAKDLTHHLEFSAIYQEKGDGVAEAALFQMEGMTVLYPYIRRSLADLEGGEGVYDITTPYGYGGYIHNAPNPTAARRLLTAFRRRLEAHCRDTAIVSEFIRFHPLMQNQEGSEDLLDRVFLHQHNVVMDLTLDDNERLFSYRESYRRCIQKALEAGLEVRLSDSTVDGSEVAALYTETMRRHRQTGYLNFQPEFFTILFNRLPENALLFTVRGGDILAAVGIFLRYGDNLEYFLSASDERMLSRHPNHLMLHHVGCWARGEGLMRLHLGGGRPSLQFFKRGFGNNVAPYYVGEHVHDRRAYAGLTDALRRRFPNAGSSGFFPAYREPVQ